MTNEELVRQYYDGDEAALEKLYHKNIGLIRGIAKETAAEFNCLIMDQHHPNQCSVYTKTILDDICGEGALEFLARIQSREYDQNCAALTTYLYPHLKGRMTRWLEQNIGCMALSKDEMAAVRQWPRHIGKLVGIVGRIAVAIVADGIDDELFRDTIIIVETVERLRILLRTVVFQLG